MNSGSNPNKQDTSESSSLSAGPVQIWVPATPRGVAESKRRTLVLCFDGTGEQFDSDVKSRLFLCRMRSDCLGASLPVF